MQSPPARTEILVRAAIRARRVSRRFSESRQADFASLAPILIGGSIWIRANIPIANSR
jgi:hypothetical protein